VKAKTQLIRDKLAAGDHVAALRIAAKFHDRSAATLTYKRGFDAHNHPSFYRQLGRDPELVTAEAIRLLISKFGEMPTSMDVDFVDVCISQDPTLVLPHTLKK